MIGFNGGLIGSPRIPAGNSSTPGMWTLEEQSEYNSIPLNVEWPKYITIFGTELIPYSSPKVLYDSGGSSTSGFAWFKSSGMSSAILMEWEPNYYDNKPWVCVFRSPFKSIATTNRIGLSIPMKGLLVQRDSLDYRAAVYWNSNQVYNATTGINADSGYTPRKVMLGYAGGHGIYNTSQNVCSWSDGNGAIGAGYDGICGAFPDSLVWGRGSGGTPIYNTTSGIWSHWVYWE